MAEKQQQKIRKFDFFLSIIKIHILLHILRKFEKKRRSDGVEFEESLTGRKYIKKKYHAINLDEVDVLVFKVPTFGQNARLAAFSHGHD